MVTVSFDSLNKALKEKLDFIPEKTEEIEAGTNNRLFKLTDKSGGRLLAKFYVKDDRNRLEREFRACSFIRDNGIDMVPVAYYKNDEHAFAVYSFANGQTKKIEGLGIEEIKLMLDFIVKLHNLSLTTEYLVFPLAVLSCLSYGDYLNNIKNRWNDFEQCLSLVETNQQVIQFSEEKRVHELINKLQKQAIGSLKGEDLNKKLSKKEQWLCPVDFGPHNALFADDGKVTFVDLEYFGWDDPARLIADFLVHDQTAGLSQELREYFEDQYKKQMNCTEKENNRLEIVKSLISIEWLTIYLQSLTPKKLENRMFADPNFKEDEYVQNQIRKFNKRVIETFR